SKRQFYSALYTTVGVGVVSVGLSMCPALAIFGIPLAGALGEWSRVHGGDLNPKPIDTARCHSPLPVDRVFSPLLTARLHSNRSSSPLNTAKSMRSEKTTVDHSDRVTTAIAQSPLDSGRATSAAALSPLEEKYDLDTTQCQSPLKRNEEMENEELQMVRELLKTAIVNDEITARSGLSEDELRLAIRSVMSEKEEKLRIAVASNESSPKVAPRTPNNIGWANSIPEVKITPGIVETPKIKQIA
ncbi:hypothetical protein PFISCL1PPCAC_14764, partial [Pristionchus fissidentatus]